MSHSPWVILDTGAASARRNMEIDTQLLEGLDPLSRSPILHVYDWLHPSVTYGHFIDPALYFVQNPCIEMAKRPTGGGVIFHTTDFAFSMLVPAAHEAYSLNVMENYAFINRLVISLMTQFMGNKAFSPFILLPHEPGTCNRELGHFCMAKPTRYDVMMGNRKVGGGAQRRTKAGFLHQGSISLAPPDEALLDKVLLPNSSVRKAMQDNTFSLFPHQPSYIELQQTRKELAIMLKALCREQRQGLG